MTDVLGRVTDLYSRRQASWVMAEATAVAFMIQATEAADPRNKYGYSVTSRIKDVERAAAKVGRRESVNGTSYSGRDLESAISDWVGVKVTCNTTADAKALIGKLGVLCTTEGNPEYASKNGKPDIMDYMKEPKDSGYRGYHAVILVPAHENAAPSQVKVELQVKTRLQDAWGELTHESFYKSDLRSPSPFHSTLAKTMADLLDVVDTYASDLATEVAAASSGMQSEDVETVGAPNGDADGTEVVEVTYLDPRYALAMAADEQVGLIRAIFVRDLLVESGAIDEGGYISVDDELEIGQSLLVTRYEETGKIFFRPASLESPARR